ncbi:unnamed protein product [Nippostrongylus brasiliensis]|uniref:DDE_Tnp_1_7 domain-containing protein n=1 Tax=Nippostrongylus brasiliensis TaxID=27835 RepID=A0A0N4XDM6_NIPBR|nr:unnamed protein product [Nippostrongylus brasiliensis]
MELDETLSRPLLDSDAHLDDNEPSPEGILLLDETDDSENEEDEDTRIFDESGWSTVENKPHPFVLEYEPKCIGYGGDKLCDFYRIFLSDDLLADISEIADSGYGSCKHDNFRHLTN